MNLRLCTFCLLFFSLGLELQAQSVAFGSSYYVWSSHATTSDGIQSWSAVSITSPSGQSYSDDTHNGLDSPDGSSGHDVTLNEAGTWQLYYTSGYDAPSSGNTSVSPFGTVTVQNPAPANSAPTINWTAAPGGVASGQTYVVSAHGHDQDGNLTQVNVWKNGQPFAFAGGGDGTDGDSGNATSDPGPTTATFTAQAVDSNGATSAMISQIVTIEAANQPPTISWNSQPGTAASGAAYFISAQGHDADGNLTQVNVWKNGTPFAFAGGGNGFDGDSGNTTSDSGPTVVTFTAQAVDSNGATSATITQTVTIAAPNQPPTISWNTAAGSVASGASYFISAHGHDADGNLTQVNVWKNGVPFAFAGGGNGTDGDSGNPTSDIGPTTVTFTAQAVDGNGATSAMISQTVTVNAPPTVTASISASPTSANSPGVTTITWSTANATSASVSGNGVTSTAMSGSQVVSGLPVGTYTYTIAAQGYGGPATQTATFTVNPPPNNAPTIAWNSTPGAVSSGQSYTISAHGHDPDGNLVQVNVWKSGAPFAFAGGGNGTDGDSGNATSDLGPTTITFTAQAVDGSGATSATISQTVMINAPPTVAASIGASPATATAPGSTLITWSTGNATTVAVNGNSLSSTATSGSQTVNELPAGTYTYTIAAQGYGGPATQTVTFVVNPPPNSAPTIAWNSTLGTVASGQSYVISAHGRDADGNLTNVNVWRNGAPYAFAGGGNGFDSDSGNPSTDTGPLTITYTAEAVDGAGVHSATISQIVTVSAPPPINRTVTASALPAGSGSITGTGIYAEGSTVTLTATPDATHIFTGWSGDINGTANPITFTVGAQSYAVGANFTLRTYTVSASMSPAGAGSVSGAGSYIVGTTATLTATPDATHVFTGWTGSLTSSSNPVSFPVNGTANLTANFALASFALTTAATSGGTVTPGGTYPPGTIVTITASPDATHTFTGWAGDATGLLPTIPVTLDRAKFVQANFTGKAAQTITFSPLGVHAASSSPFALNATASSGLTVSFSVLSGPATISGDLLQLTGAGAIVVQATQPGDAFYLPAAPASQTFNSVAAAQLKYRGQTKTLIQAESATEAPPFVLEKP